MLKQVQQDDEVWSLAFRLNLNLKMIKEQGIKNKDVAYRHYRL